MNTTLDMTLWERNLASEMTRNVLCSEAVGSTDCQCQPTISGCWKQLRTGFPGQAEVLFCFHRRRKCSYQEISRLRRRISLAIRLL
jgi:hypothetical protein